jgi:hypothetical protein
VVWVVIILPQSHSRQASLCIRIHTDKHGWRLIVSQHGEAGRSQEKRSCHGGHHTPNRAFTKHSRVPVGRKRSAARHYFRQETIKGKKYKKNYKIFASCRILETTEANPSSQPTQAGHSGIDGSPNRAQEGRSVRKPLRPQTEATPLYPFSKGGAFS